MDLIDRAEVLCKFVEILPDPYRLDWYKQAKPEEVKDLVDLLKNGAFGTTAFQMNGVLILG